MLRTVTIALACLCVLASADPARAQHWPSKPVRIVVPFAPGGSSDQLARILAPELSAVFGQQFYVENRGGSSGAIGAAVVAKSAPDGHTLVNAGSGPHLTGPAINPNVGYDPMKDFTHIAMVAAVQAQFAKLSLLTQDLDPAGVTKFVADEYAYWAPLAKEIGLRVQ